MEHFYYTLGENWFTYSPLYAKIASHFPSKSHFVEVGVWKGMSAAYMAVEIINQEKDIKFDCVDTWEFVSEEKTGISEDCYEDLYNIFLKNISSVKHIITPVKKISWEAANDYEDKSLDFIFIDAAHDYDSVKKDIEAWFPKLKDNGVIAGHDYELQVQDAVDEYFIPLNYEIQKGYRCWVISPSNNFEIH
jgi:predicted O-methyltransferase YrrM